MIRTEPLIHAMAFILGGILFPAAAQAQNSLTIMLNEAPDFTAVRYTCTDGAQIDVTYINTSYQSFALVPIDGIENLFVTVITGSGVRYVSDIWEWSSQGDEAVLSNLLTQSDPQNCQATAQ